MQLLHAQEARDSQQTLLKLILDEDELSWQQIIYDLVRKEEMDPWNIDLGELTQQFLGVIRKLQKMDFRISGKLVLASAVLLKIKSDRLMGEDLVVLDSLITQTEEDDTMDLFEMDFDAFSDAGVEQAPRPRIYPRTPQPRQRKVSVYDLVSALEQALEVSVRREQRTLDRVETVEVKIPEKKIDVSQAMNALLQKISQEHNGETHFHILLPGDSAQEKVLTFIPLLHLTNERRIDLDQEVHFGEIGITMLSDEPVEYHEAEEVLVA